MATGPLPTARNVHHVSVTVSDLDAAVAFFVDAIGCECLYRKGPFGDPDGDSMARRLGVHADARARLAMLRCGPATNLELFEWESPDQETRPPRNSDVGAMHLGLEVDDVDAAMAALEARMTWTCWRGHGRTPTGNCTGRHRPGPTDTRTDND